MVCASFPNVVFGFAKKIAQFALDWYENDFCDGFAFEVINKPGTCIHVVLFHVGS